MSESREKKRRYNEKLQYIAEFNRWLAQEPPFWALIRWIRWKRARPVRRD